MGEYYQPSGETNSQKENGVIFSLQFFNVPHTHKNYSQRKNRVKNAMLLSVMSDYEEAQHPEYSLPA